MRVQLVARKLLFTICNTGTMRVLVRGLRARAGRKRRGLTGRDGKTRERARERARASPLLSPLPRPCSLPSAFLSLPLSLLMCV